MEDEDAADDKVQAIAEAFLSLSADEREQFFDIIDAPRPRDRREKLQEHDLREQRKITAWLQSIKRRSAILQDPRPAGE